MRFINENLCIFNITLIILIFDILLNDLDARQYKMRHPTKVRTILHNANTSIRSHNTSHTIRHHHNLKHLSPSGHLQEQSKHDRSNKQHERLGLCTNRGFISCSRGSNAW